MTEILFVVIAAVVGIAVGYIVRKTVGESKIKSAEAEAARIMEEATKNTDAIRKEAILEAKDEAHKIRNEAEAEVKERRAEQQRSEKRLIQKEEALDRKTEALEQKELSMQKTEAQIEKIKASVEDLYAQQSAELERFAKSAPIEMCGPSTSWSTALPKSCNKPARLANFELTPNSSAIILAKFATSIE